MDQRMQKIMMKGMLEECGEDVKTQCNDIIASLHGVTDKVFEDIKTLSASDDPEEREKSQKMQAALGCAIGIFGIELTEALGEL